jgi:hypothetical protein
METSLRQFDEGRPKDLVEADGLFHGVKPDAIIHHVAVTGTTRKNVVKSPSQHTMAVQSYQ